MCVSVCALLCRVFVASAMHNRFACMFRLSRVFFLCCHCCFFGLVITKLVLHFFCFLFSCVLHRDLIFVVHKFLSVLLRVCFCFYIVCANALFPHWFAMIICMHSFFV